MKKKNIVKITIAVVVVALIGGGALYYHSSTVSAAKAKNAARYSAIKAKQGTLAVTVQSTGTVSAATSDDLVSFNNGIISSVNVKEGDTVKKGQTIGFINDTTLQQSVSLAQLKVSQDNTTIANNKTTLQQSINVATLKVQEDKNNIANNKDSQKVDSNNVSLEQDQADLTNKTAQLSSASSDTSQLQGDQTDLNNKTAQLAKQTVTSPIDGVIVTLNFKNGDTVQSGKSIATVVDMKSLQITAQVDELDISKVKNGQKATITFDALTGKTFTGTVSKVSELGTTTSNVTNYAVYIAIDNPTGIKIAMNGNINITVASKANVVTLSLDAVQTINGKKYVLTSIPTATGAGNSSSKRTSGGTSTGSSSGSSTTRSYSGNSGTATSGTSGMRTMRNSSMKEVTTGLTNQTDVEIVSGLKDGDTAYITLPTVSTSTSTTSTSRTSGASSFGGASGSGFGGGSGAAGGSRGGN